jgi:N-acetyl sugar amidotransferase
MDTTARDITFDDEGVCSYCTEFLTRSSHILQEDPGRKAARLEQLVDKVRHSGRGKPYDCIVGVSGGVDSSWTLVELKRLGLRPLAVHMDNGWDSELAQSNIANLVRALDVDLYTHVIDWEEYRGLMQAFFDADVVDVELLYDNAMLAVNYRQARKYGLHYILAGTNQATEGMRMPPGWNWFKFDKAHIKALGRRSGISALKTYPAIGTLEYLWNECVTRTRWISFLDYVEYNKESVLSALESQYGYKRYPFKHYESVFTRFYQGYILPHKFGVDKRRLHVATLVAAGQLNRADALAGLQGIAYPTPQDEARDIDYFLKKMRWTRQELEDYIRRPGKCHSEYRSERHFLEIPVAIVDALPRRWNQMVKQGLGRDA